jgi:signal transduction histidine kinase
MSEEEAAALRLLGAAMVMPMAAQQKLAGFIAAGPAITAESDQASDAAFLKAVADRTAVAVRSAAMLAHDAERLREMERLGALKSTLLQTVSHELKSPLTAIKVSVELLELQRSGDPDPVNSRLMRTLKSGIGRLEKLTQESLDYAAMQSAQLKLQLAPVPLRKLVDDAVALFAEPMRGRRQQVLVKGDTGLNVMGDAARLERVLVNLVSNAYKYTPEGSRVLIEIGSNGDTHFVSVSDNGPGIPAEELELIFSPYYRSKLADCSGSSGTGLGLSIARYLAELHGGTLTATSTLGKGATFTLTLPAAAAQDDEDRLSVQDAAARPVPIRVSVPLPVVGQARVLQPAGAGTA